MLSNDRCSPTTKTFGQTHKPTQSNFAKVRYHDITTHINIHTTFISSRKNERKKKIEKNTERELSQENSHSYPTKENFELYSNLTLPSSDSKFALLGSPSPKVLLEMGTKLQYPLISVSAKLYYQGKNSNIYSIWEREGVFQSFY